jgi:ElaB/YqjD/DUF883 family membrane-anchored ribosome-binding protein
MATTSSNPSLNPASASTGLPPGAGALGSNGSSAAGPAEMLHNVAQGAHQTIDRLAEQVQPQLQRLQENMAGATEMMDERADQLRMVADEWVETLRCTVRDNPLAAVGTALAIGLLVARLSR